ncbi:MAG: tetratricopeptide repeat protein [Herpetosiphonaceae bacterium]|nr:tetratricopeptide repeat protein [Herpetosiphonaceae bacterium]
MIEWNVERVQELLQHPQRVLREDPWRAWVAASGGLSAMYAQLRALPLPHDQRRVLEALIDQPGESVASYANTLGVHVTTYYRHLRRLAETLRDFLNAEAARVTPAGPRLRQLPAVPTSFIGRTGEITAICALLAGGARLLTLTGLGGTGKTRISLHVAARLADQWSHGVVFVALATISGAEFVRSAIVQALGIKEVSGQSLETTLLEYLHDKHLLLVLDNFEHVIDAAPLVGTLLGAAPRLTVLVTSRTVLHIYGEQTFVVPPLAAPNPAHLPSLDLLHDSEAIRLFVARALAADASFVLSQSNARAVAEICYRLDGLPLALELAAARIRLLPPADLLARLDQRLPVLSSGSRDLPQRQQTLRDMMDWSYQLLSATERDTFIRLSVWTGGWTVEAAATMLGVESTDLNLLETLAALLDSSLILRDPAAESRWTMLQIVREYALSRLAESDQLAVVQRQHGEYIVNLAEVASPELNGAQQELWLARLEQEHDNVRAALHWSIVHAPLLALQLSGALWRFWWTHSHLSEGRSWLEQVLALPGEATAAARVRALNGTGALAWSQGDYDPATRYFEQCLALQRSIGDTRGAAMTLNNLGLVAIKRADYAQATAFFSENLPIFRDLDDLYSYAATLSNLGMVARYQGDYAQARRLFEESLAPRRALANRWAIAASLTNLGVVALYQHDYAQARELYHESLAILADLGEKESIAECLEGLAGVFVAQQQPVRAARLCGAAEALRSAIGAPLSPTDQALYTTIAQSVRAALDGPTFEQAWLAGQRLNLEAAIGAALDQSDPG